MTIKEKILAEIKDAQKKKDVLKLSALRMIKSAIDYKELEEQAKPKDEKEEKEEKEQKKRELEDSEVIKVIQNIAKQRKESIESFRKGGREEAAKKEEAELKIVESYLPKALSTEEMEKIITEAISETGASSMKDMGKVMKACMEKFKGQVVDNKVVSVIVKTKLN